jgi:hypothetical protein
LDADNAVEQQGQEAGLAAEVKGMGKKKKLYRKGTGGLV